MRKRAFRVLATAVGLLSMSTPLFAHHGTSVFDLNQKLTMKGSVTEWDWSNPHCLLQFDVKNEAGQVTHWIAETQNPAEMVSLGWGKASFKAGDDVAVTLMPAKNGRPFGRIILVALPNGRTFDTVARPATKDPGGSSGGAKSEDYPKK